MIIPFEPKLYMGEVDREINAETHLSAKEIKYKFRDGLNQQIQKAFLNEHFGALDLMEDTGRYRNDIETIYEHLSYEYQKVPDQEKYKQPESEKKQKHPKSDRPPSFVTPLSAFPDLCMVRNNTVVPL